MAIVLFQDRYDLNIRRIRMVIDPDTEERCPEEQHDLTDAALERRLSVIVYDGEIVRDIFAIAGGSEDPWDVRLAWRDGQCVEAHGQTERGRDFLRDYFQMVAEVACECRCCTRNLAPCAPSARRGTRRTSRTTAGNSRGASFFHAAGWP